MKKLLTFFLTALLAFSVGWAAEVTDVLNRAFTGVDNGTSTYSSWSGKTSYSPAVYAGNSAGSNNSIQLRSNNSNSGIVTTTSGGKVKSITVSWSSSTVNGRTLNVYGKNSAYSAATDLYGNNSGTLLGTIVKGTSTSLTITGDYEYIGFRSASGAMYLLEVSIVWETSGGGTTVTAPTISPNGGNFATSQKVTLSHDDADAAIYYTTNGAEPTTSSTLYTSPFTIYETTTVKAIAVKDGVSSSPASATFNEVGVATIAEAYALNQGSQFIFTGNAVVTYQNDRYVWIRDNSGSGLIYRKSGDTSDMSNGDILNAGWTATNTTYNSIPEFSNPTDVASNSNGGAVAPYDKTSTGVTSANVNEYVSFSNITPNWDTNLGYCYVTYGNNKVYFRNTFFSYINNGLTVTSGHTYNIEGIVYHQNNNVFVYMTSVTEIQSSNPLLEVSPSELTINDTDNTLTITGENITGNINASLANNTDWYLTSNQFSNTGGTTNVVYNGRDLSASNTVSVSAIGVQNIDVPVNYLADLYIVTDNGYTGQWNFNDGTSMTYNNGVYTASFTAERANTYILFARKLGNGVDWNTRFVFGPDSGGDWWLPIDGNGSGNIDLYDDDPIKIQTAGTYIITIDATGSPVTFTITKEEAPQGDVYEKVTSNDDLVSGDYLIVYETDSKAFDGSLADMDPVNNVFDVTISNNKIITDKAAYFTIDTDAGTIYSASGKYIGRASNSNGFNQSETTAYTHTITIDNSANAIITSSNGPKLQMWSQMSNGVMQYRFRYYSSNQKSIQLYRKQGGSTVVTAPVITPEGGTSNKHFESFNVTITAAEGCTIYYTTDGSTPTTSSTPYSAPFLLPYGSEPTTVKAIAVDGQGTVSAVASMTYYWDRVSVTINPASQHVTGDVNVTITATPSDATVTYTINGGAVQTYNGEFIVPVNETNSPVTVEVTATKGESTATTSATYILVDASATLYTKVTSADQIVPGNKYILVYEDTPEALNGVTSGGTGVEVAWATQGSVINVAETNALQFTLGGSANAATLSYDLGSTTYYLEPGNAPNLDLTDQATEGYEWTITESDGGYVLTWGNYVLRYNNGAQAANGRFRIYQPNASTGQLSGHPVYLYVQGAYVTLSDLAQTGVKNKKYTISNELKAVCVTWDADESSFAIFAKDNGNYANPSAPSDTQKSYVIEYESDDFTNSVAQEDYDQSNWIEILIPSDVTSKTEPNAYTQELGALQGRYEGKTLKAGSITGTYVDDLNPTIQVNVLPDDETSSSYTPNIYCAANFLKSNIDNGALGVDGEYYFMMDAKPNEFCKVVWGYYDSNNGNYFVIPAREGNVVNGHGFHGSFKADLSLSSDQQIYHDYDNISAWITESNDPSFNGQQFLYTFDAVVRKNPNYSNPASGAPRRIQPGTGDFEQNPAYIVYPIISNYQNPEGVVSVKEVLGNKAIESVHYYNMMGMEGKTPFEGINIVVTRYTDGSTSTTKVMK